MKLSRKLTVAGLDDHGLAPIACHAKQAILHPTLLAASRQIEAQSPTQRESLNVIVLLRLNRCEGNVPPEPSLVDLRICLARLLYADLA